MTFAGEEEDWTFVPAVTPELTIQAIEFREWLTNNDNEGWEGCLRRYRQHLETNGTPQHVARFLEARARLARNQRRTINFASSGPNEPYEINSWYEYEDDSTNSEDDPDETDIPCQTRQMRCL